MPDRPDGRARPEDGRERQRADSVPAIGDVLVSLIGGVPTIYGIRVIPSVCQVVFETYEDAHEHAERFARNQRVDVWTSSDPGGEPRFVRGARYRPPSGDGS